MFEKPRIAIFDNWIPFHIGNEIKDPQSDRPIKWNEFMNSPNFEVNYENGAVKTYTLNDSRAIDEVHRLLKFKTCPICKKNMIQRLQEFSEIILVCLSCGFWGGRGSRMDNAWETIGSRGVLGIYKPLSSINEADTEYLVTHLKRFPNELPKIGPKRAERFVLDLLGEYLDCEVMPIGGTKDKGVDGYIIKNDKIHSIIQIKWREHVNGAESVKVIREVAGTLLARGIPSGILVSNRDHYSKDALEDAKLVSKRTLANLGEMSLTLMDYHHILDMLDFSNTRLTDKMTLEDWIQIENGYEVFEGVMKLRQDFVNMFQA